MLSERAAGELEALGGGGGGGGGGLKAKLAAKFRRKAEDSPERKVASGNRCYSHCQYLCSDLYMELNLLCV